MVITINIVGKILKIKGNIKHVILNFFFALAYVNYYNNIVIIFYLLN